MIFSVEVNGYLSGVDMRKGGRIPQGYGVVAFPKKAAHIVGYGNGTIVFVRPKRFHHCCTHVVTIDKQLETTRGGDSDIGIVGLPLDWKILSEPNLRGRIYLLGANPAGREELTKGSLTVEYQSDEERKPHHCNEF